MQKAPVEYRPGGHFLHMEVILDVAASARRVNTFRHPALCIQIQPSGQGAVEPIVMPKKKRGFERQGRQMAPVVGLRTAGMANAAPCRARTAVAKAMAVSVTMSLRVAVPDGTANPCHAHGDSAVSLYA